MDRKSWPWKKKSPDKQAASAASNTSATVSDTSGPQVDKAKQDKPKYVQISLESYVHLTGLEDEVKSYEEQVQDLEDKVKELNEKLSEANSEMVNKDNLVKQHTKVAEEAVSGWEKADAEAAALKNHLESVTLLKTTAEDKASHLDGALKECMKQIRNLKEEHDKKLHEVVLSKTKLFDKMKQELEAKIANLDQELLRSAADNAALSRSLHERSNMLIHMSEEKSRAEADIECLKGNIESYEKEMNSLKYEVRVAKKEVEIRNEEKDMSVRSADVANKHHFDAVKKIAKLEAECQRLRGLVRKRLPGPAALAQMKLEVENFGRGYGESHVRRSPVKFPVAHLSQSPEFAHDDSQKYVKENELLTERLLAMEEETKMLKEALEKCNSELQDSRSVCALAVGKLHTLETQHQLNDKKKNNPKSSTHASSCTVSDDGNDDTASCSGSLSTGLISELSRFGKGNSVDGLHKRETSNNLDLMDDFLEMEKLAYQSDRQNGATPHADFPVNAGNEASEFAKNEASVEMTSSKESQSIKQNALTSRVSPKEDEAVANSQLHGDPLIFVRLQSRVSMVLDSISNEKNMKNLVEDIKSVMLEMQSTLHRHSVNGFETGHRSDTMGMSISGELETAVSQIYDFIMILGKEAKALLETSPDGDGLNKNINIFSAKYNNIVNSDFDLIDFVHSVSYVLTEASALHFSVLGSKNLEVESSSFDCIDKIALPENKDVQNTLEGRYPNGCTHFSDSSSDPDVQIGGNLVPTTEKTASSWKCSLEEFEELKKDKESLAGDLARCSENFENTKAQLLETEKLLTEVKSQLVSAQKSNSLAETQLKCMAESYRSLESQAEELQTEVNLLQGKVHSLENDLQEERKRHQDATDRCKDLQEQLDRIDSHSAVDSNKRTNQELELTAAAEKLAECQETIFVLGKQLKALHPQTPTVSSPDIRSKRLEAFLEDGPIVRAMSFNDVDSEAYTGAATPPHSHRIGLESPLVALNSTFSPSDSEPDLSISLLRSKHHRPSKSLSSTISSTPTPTPEKHARGFSRFFSSKPKYSQ